jgi:magnesium transporter
VIEVEIFSYFSRLHQKAWNLEQIDSDMGMLKVRLISFSSQSHKMNEIMKTLTIVSAILYP